jgi:Domain of unknown function (DUF4397)
MAIARTRRDAKGRREQHVCDVAPFAVRGHSRGWYALSRALVTHPIDCTRSTRAPRAPHSALLLFVFFPGPLFGCAGDDTNPPPPDAGAPDASIADASTDAPDAPSDSGDAQPPPTVAGVRFALWSPDAPPVDFCLGAHGTGVFTPPLLAALWNAGDAGGPPDAGLPPLAFPNVTAYLYVPPGHYDVRIVVGGAGDCATGVAPDLTSLGTLAAGALATIALVGEAHPVAAVPPLALRAFLDDVEPKGAVGLRAINAAPAIPAAAFGTGTLAKSFNALFSSVAFGAAGMGPDGGAPDGSAPIDPNAYASVAALSGATLSAHAPGATADAVVATDISVAAGSLVTFVLLAGSAGAPSIQATQLLECIDNAGTLGPLSLCTIAE